MNNKFKGSLEELKREVDKCGQKGEWLEKNGKHTFRAESGAILNWWPSKGTISIQGVNTETLECVFRTEMQQSDKYQIPITECDKKEIKHKIFIVHGHDLETKDQLELILRRLDLEPFILQDSDGQGLTLIEALEKRIIQESAFGIVLMTPDDFGYSKEKSDDHRQPRARQNVILEMGMIMAALGRHNMVILKKGNLEIPSDAEGIIRLEFNDQIKEIGAKLIQRLQGVGIKIDQSKVAVAIS